MGLCDYGCLCPSRTRKRTKQVRFCWYHMHFSSPSSFSSCQKWLGPLWSSELLCFIHLTSRLLKEHGYLWKEWNWRSWWPNQAWFWQHSCFHRSSRSYKQGPVSPLSGSSEVRGQVYRAWVSGTCCYHYLDKTGSDGPAEHRGRQCAYGLLFIPLSELWIWSLPPHWRVMNCVTFEDIHSL